jgi:DNA mismatch repair ATPase MutS
MWSTQLALAIETWRAASGEAVGRWLDAVGEMEALCDLAAFSFENPAYPFPAIEEGEARFEAERLGHPLIPAEACVRNGLGLGPHRRVLIVSGSNMSGKSTLLRAVGINAVLAQAGAPVCAAGLRMSPLVVGASMRIHDSLSEGTSRFYAEITRLKRIVDLTRGSAPVLFLLDEMLNGTNSHDRRIGAGAVVGALASRRAIGLITTHDLALAHIADAPGSHAANVHFEDRIDGGRITFDYVMRPGVVTRSNGLALMRAVGLDVGSEEAVAGEARPG